MKTKEIKPKQNTNLNRVKNHTYKVLNYTELLILQSLERMQIAQSLDM